MEVSPTGLSGVSLLSASPAGEAKDAFERAQAFLGEQRFADAKGELAAAVAAPEVFSREEYLTTLATYGMVCARTGEVAKALPYCRQAVELAQELKLPNKLFNAQKFLGNCLQMLGLIPEAMQAFQEALKICEELGFWDDRAAIFNNLGLIHQREEAWEAARKAFEQALHCYSLSGQADAIRIARFNLAGVQYEAGEIAEARKNYHMVEVESRADQDWHHLGIVLGAKARLAVRDNDLAGAAEKIDASRAYLERTGQPFVLAELELDYYEELLNAGHTQGLDSLLLALRQLFATDDQIHLDVRALEMLYRLAETTGDEKLQLSRLKLLREKEREQAHRRNQDSSQALKVLHETEMAEKLATKERERSEALERALNQAEASEARALEATRTKTGILRMVAHDLRTPVSAMISALEMLKDQPNADEASLLRELAAGEGRHAICILERLLDAASLETGRLDLQPEAVDLYALVAHCLDSFRVCRQAKGQTFDLRLEGTLPSLQADPERLKQILSNLLSNAIKYSRHGGDIVVALSADADHVWVEVIDDGPGLPPDQLEAVFQPFHRVPTSVPTGDERTLGLGLSIARELANQHGGSLCAKSEGLGTGCTFILELPR